MCRYLAKTFPHKVKDLPEQAVRESIRAGIERAAVYGISAEYDVARYIDFMYRFSPDFDSNPDAPWVRPTLASSVMPPGARMNVIRDQLAEADNARSAGQQKAASNG